MKPIRIEIQAFEAYAGTEVIDFRRLEERTLFLITGPTGSGKSSLLDAICFALYGESAGAERDVRELRSHRADQTLATRVRFDFSLGTSDLYRVERFPAQERPKLRGEGLVSEAPRATLWRRNGLTNDTEEGQVLATKWSEVTQEIENLLHFRASEFRQVVMLPQGQFQTFLLANSVERQQILETLFQTSFYRLIESKLKDKASAIRAEHEALRASERTILQQSGCETLDTLRARANDVITQITACNKELETHQRESSRLEKETQEANRVLGWFADHDAASAGLATLIAREPEQNDRKVVLARAEKATTLHDVMNQAALREGEYRESQNKAKETESALANARRRFTHAAAELAKEKDNDSSRADAQKRLLELEGATSKVKAFEAAMTARNAAIETEKEANNARERIAESISQIKVGLAKAQKKKETKQGLAGDAKTLRAELVTLKTALKNAGTLQGKSKEHRANERTISALKKKIESLEADLKSAEKHYGELHRNWVKGQAARLAKTLLAGEGCPVCGSTRHPTPCQSRVDLPADEDLDEDKEAVDALRGQVNEVKESLGTTEKQQSALSAAIETLQDGLGDLAGTSVSQLEGRTEKLGERCEEAKQASEEVRELDDEIIKLIKRVENLTESHGKAEKKASKAAEDRAEAAGSHKELESGLPKGIRTLDALETAIRGQRGEYTRLQELLDKAIKEEGDAKNEVATLEGALTTAKDSETTSAQRSSQARQDSLQRLTDAGFSDMQDFQSAIRDSVTMVGFRAAIKKHDEDLSGARGRTQDAAEKVAGLTKPDIEPLKAALEEAKKQAQAAAISQGSLQTKLQSDQASIQTLEQLSRDIAKKDGEYQVIGKMATVANGDNLYRMQFQSYVLAAFLDEVLRSASTRLHRMSQNRYMLQRQTGTASGRGKAGLDVEVYDSYSGTTRSTKTLSGGEQFMASLSLALGLADVVRSFAGGVQLETVFVDEGFGSLDSETLDQAMQVLLGLQETGRMVGLISHVPEMKERITTRLEVIPGASGSRTEFFL